MKNIDFKKQLASYVAELRKTIEAKATGFDFNQQAQAERIKAVLDATDGFDFFVKTYFPHYIRSEHRSQLHNYLFARLSQVAQSSTSCLEAIAAPRGEAKSTIVTRLYTLWCEITNRKRFSVIVMDSIDQAYPMLESIKAELEFNARLKMDFPQATGVGRVWQSGTIVTAQGNKMQIAGSGKKLRGLIHGAYRPDLVILDDIENDEQVRNPEQRDKLHAWLTKTVLPLGAAGEKMDVIYIGTVLHYDSVLSRTLNNASWHTARFKALLKQPDNMQLWDRWEELYRNDGELVADAFYATNQQEMDAGAEVSWQARPLLALMKIRARDGHATFDSEYQNDPVSGEDAPFTHSISYWAELPPNLVYFGAVDPSLGKAGASRDPSAILVGGFERKTGTLYVLEAQIKKRLPDLIIEDVIALQQRYHCALWVIETVQFQEFLKTEIIKRSAIRGVPVPARGIKPSTDKLLRIESLQPHMANGLIKLHSTQATLINQLRHFPKADHDDGPDALHMLWMAAVSGAAPMQITLVNRHQTNYGDEDASASRYSGEW